ncbi:hypothetical protein [Burkholderia ubonensis]|uniref:hypothetical protein n=1 Tax=Burkholderia ubonensis TaxID=101571 RepID=UPI000A4126E5|nr:hypothetical protein [Burkholderia ubonensis]
MSYTSCVFKVKYVLNNSATSTQQVTGCASAEEAADKVRRSFGASTIVEIISVTKIR